jgi:hypothetical protein
MKNFTLLVSIILINIPAFCQDSESDSDVKSNLVIGVFTNVGINYPIRFQKYIDPYEPRAFYANGSYSVGVKFSKALSTKRKIEIGAVYSVHKVGYKDPEVFILSDGRIYHETFETLSIPINFKYYLKNNSFLNFGPMIDIGLPRNSPYMALPATDTQTGFGFSIGAGKDFNLSNFILDITPNFEIHSVVPFSAVAGQQRLLVFGIRIGLVNKCL